MPAPGMLERHYAPSAKLIVCKDLPELLTQREAFVARVARGLAGHTRAKRGLRGGVPSICDG